jgi:signal transduction histidine kinase
MRMEQRDQRRGAAAAGPVPARAACAVAAAAVVAAVAWVLWLRADNPGAEPEGKNWWLVAWFAVALAYSVTGTAFLADRAIHRPVGAAFVIIGAAAAITGSSIQYAAHEAALHADGGWLGEASGWSEVILAGSVAGVVPWLLRPGTWRPAGAIAAATAVLVAIAAATVDADGALAWLHRGASWAIAASATGAVVALITAWWPVRKGTDDPLPAWLTCGAMAAWLAFVPGLLSLDELAIADNDVVRPVLTLATVPLLVGGAVIAAIRDRASPFLGLSTRTLEWAVLASGIVAVYTGLVAGLGSLLGGNGPTWLLVAGTGVIALVLEPVRQRIRWLVDRLVYGARDDPLAVVQRIVDQLGAGAAEDLLPALVTTLRDELRLDAVAIELRVDGGWRQGAATGAPTRHRRVVMLTHHGEVAGRLIVGWEDAPSLRHRDERILEQLIGPLSLAVGWVRLTEDLRRSSVAIVSAREEERRRLRRDLHDGIGPSLTGVSLGLRTAVRQLARVAARDGVEPAQRLLEQVADEVDASVGELKRIVRDLRPTALDQLGLVGAVAEFTRGLGDAVEMHLTLPDRPVELPAAVEVATYRIVTEAVTNVVRHARAARCWLTIDAGPSVVIDVVDDGVGIPSGEQRGVGLTAMHERAAELGGSVRVRPNHPSGTHVHVMLPAALP